MERKSIISALKMKVLLVFTLVLLSVPDSMLAQSCTVNAGLDRTICINQTLQLDGTSSGDFASGPTWRQVSGPSVVISDPNIDDPIITGLIGGNVYEFELSAECQNGTTPSQRVEITVIGITIADAGPDIQSCPDSSGSIVITGNAVNTAAGETGVWSFQGGSNPAGVVIDDTSAATTVITLPEGSAGTSTLVWTITSSGGACESEDQVNVTNYGGETPVEAGPDQTTDNCYTVSQTATLNGSFGGIVSSGVQSGMWSLVSTTATELPSIGTPTNNSTGVTNLREGVHIFRWDVSGPCVTGSDTVTITVPAPTQEVTTPDAGPTQRICDPSVTSVTLSGTLPQFAGETVLWEPINSNAMGTTIVNDMSNTTQVTGLSAPGSGNRSYTYRYSISNPAIPDCTLSDTVTISYNIGTSTILLNDTNGDGMSEGDITLACGTTEADIPYVTTSGNRTQYRILSGPSDSSLSLPTGFTNLGSGSNGTVNEDRFDVPGAYTLEFQRIRTGGLLLGCDQAVETIKVTLSENPSGSNAGSPQTFACGQVNGSLSGSAILPGETSFWSLLPGEHGLDNSVIDDRFDRNTTLTGLVPGEYVFQYVVSGGDGCPPATSTTTVTVTPLSNFPVNAGTPQTVCFNAPVQLAADPLLASQVGTWSSPDGIVFSDVNDPNAIATGFVTPSTSYILTWTADERPGFVDCAAPAQSTVTITTTADESPTIADAGTDQCLPPTGSTTTANLSANSITPLDVDEQGTWTVVSGPSTPTFTPNANDPNAVAGNLVNGQYILRWTIDNVPPTGACTPTSDDVQIVIADTSTTVSAGSDDTHCVPAVTGSFQMNASDPSSLGGQGTWRLVSGPTGFIVDDENSPTAIFSNLSNGTYVFEWEIDYGGCPATAPAQQVTREVGIEPTVANITSSFTEVCNDDEVLINADALTNPNIESGFWSVIAGPNTPTISPADAMNPVPNEINVEDLITGQYTLRWTIIGSSSLCPDSSDDITFNVYKQSEVINNIDVCEATSVVLEATEGTTGTWSLITVNGGAPTPTELTNNGPTQAPSDSYIANANVEVAVPGVDNVYVYRYTTNYPAPCSNTSRDVTVTVSSGPSEEPDAGPPVNICLDDPTPGANTSVVLTAGNASIPADVDTVQWTVLDQPGSGASFTSGANTLTPTLSGLSTPGLYIVELNFSTNGCTDLSDVARIEVFEAPTPIEAGPNQTNACQLDFRTDADAPTIGVGVWSILSHPAGSAATATIDNINERQTGMSNIEVGTYILQWTVTSGPFGSGPCGPQSDTVEITFPALPPSTAEAGPDQEFCDSPTTFLGATTLAEGTGLWSIDSQPVGSTVNIVSPNNPNSLVQDITPGVYVFRWTATGGGCTNSDTVQITMYSDPITAEAGPDQVIPEFSTVTLGATPATAGVGTWSQISGPTTANFINANDPGTVVAGTQPGTYVFEWRIQNGSCNDAVDQVTVIITPISDLELSKTASPTSANVGDTVTFTIAVTNNDSSGVNSDATGVEVRDVLPLGYSIVPGTVSNGGSFDPGTQTLQWTGLSITNGATLNLTFDATINGSGSYANTAQISGSDNFDPDSTPNNNVASEDDQDDATISIQSADLSLEKLVTPTDVSVGNTVTFTINISNAGPDVANNVTIEDIIPIGYSGISSISNSGVLNGTGDEITWNLANVPVGVNAVTLTFDAIVDAPTGSANEYTNSAQVLTSDQADPDSTPGNKIASEDDQDDAAITLEQADLELSKSVSPTSGNPGDAVTFTIQVDNVASVTATGDATGVEVQDILPTGYTITPGTISSGGTYNVGSGTITWSGLSIANGSNIVLTFDATVNPSGVYTNIAQVTASDLPDPDSTPGNSVGAEDDQDDAVFSVDEIALSIDKRTNPVLTSTTVGSTITFEIEVSNAGSLSTATGVQVQDLLPPGYELQTGTISNSGIASFDRKTITWNNLTIASGSSIVLTYDVIVNAPTGVPDEYKNVVQVTDADQNDNGSIPNNDDGDQSEPDEDALTIPTPQTADLSLVKSVSDGTPNVGDTVTFSLAISNAGANAATGVNVSDVV
ncbi:Ig-like domain-containing protein, partial [uncultured Tenacibaculum sp.]|uniref:Ig-like domain-containing protein n=1 Tax=uncultured Tenacibaculum sp. TaxID=174713 RepID=UPI00262BB30D